MAKLIGGRMFRPRLNTDGTITHDEVTGYMEQAAEKARAYREAIESMMLTPGAFVEPLGLKPEPCICVHGRSRYCPRHVD